MSTDKFSDDFKRDLVKLNKQTEGLLDRIVEATNPSVITAYEKRI